MINPTYSHSTNTAHTMGGLNHWVRAIDILAPFSSTARLEKLRAVPKRTNGKRLSFSISLSLSLALVLLGSPAENTNPRGA